MLILKRIGPITQPCGTPCSRGISRWSIIINWYTTIPTSNIRATSRVLPVKPALAKRIININELCVSKVANRSRKSIIVNKIQSMVNRIELFLQNKRNIELTEILIVFECLLIKINLDLIIYLNKYIAAFSYI